MIIRRETVDGTAQWPAWRAGHNTIYLVRVVDGPSVQFIYVIGVCSLFCSLLLHENCCHHALLDNIESSNKSD